MTTAAVALPGRSPQIEVGSARRRPRARPDRARRWASSAANEAEALLERVCVPPGWREPPQTLLVLAHPDDETVSAASRLIPLAPRLLLYATNGAPRDGSDARAAGFASTRSYARARKAEVRKAVAHAGISSDRLEFLDCPDQEAALHLVALTREIAARFSRFDPAVVLTHPYEGGHPDHDAVCFAVHAAVAILARTGRAHPLILEFTSYHASGPNWVFGQFLPSTDRSSRVIELTLAERNLKRRMVAAHRSQARTLQGVPIDRETFRRAPDYTFTAAPCPGPLLYERFNWGGMSRDRWLELASAASRQLGLPGSPGETDVPSRIAVTASA